MISRFMRVFSDSSTKLWNVSFKGQAQHSQQCMTSKNSPMSKNKKNVFDDLDENFIEDILEDKINLPNQKTGGNQSRKAALREAEEKHRKFVKQKIIQKKIKALFEDKQPSLLTWAARMQIKYLNKTDPHYWTPSMLAESFPVSKDVIIKILKSSKLPYNEKEIAQHDKRVYRNWLKLREAKRNLTSGGPVDPSYRLVAESSKMCLMRNAAGSKSLPMPETRSEYLTQVAIAEHLKPKLKGEFSAILESYETAKAELSKDEQVKHIGIEDPEYMKLLEEISENSTGSVSDTSKHSASVVTHTETEGESPNFSDMEFESFSDWDIDTYNATKTFDENQHESASYGRVKQVKDGLDSDMVDKRIRKR